MGARDRRFESDHPDHPRDPNAGGRDGAVLFPFATDAPTRRVFGSLDGPLGLLVPLMIGLAGVAVLGFSLAFLATLGLWVPANLWRPLVLVGAGCSAALLILHASIYAVLPLAIDAGLAWIAWTSLWSPATA